MHGKYGNYGNDIKVYRYSARFFGKENKALELSGVRWVMFKSGLYGCCFLKSDQQKVVLERKEATVLLACVERSEATQRK